jgi:hypothetical protein
MAGLLILLTLFDEFLFLVYIIVFYVYVTGFYAVKDTC